MSEQLFNPAEVVKVNPVRVIERLFPRAKRTVSCVCNESEEERDNVLSMEISIMNKHEADELVQIQSTEIDKLRGESNALEYQKFSLEQRVKKWETLHASWVKDVVNLQQQVKHLKVENATLNNEKHEAAEQIEALKLDKWSWRKFFWRKPN